MKKNILLLAILWVGMLDSNPSAQIITRIGEIKVCPGAAQVPVLVSDFQAVASLSLKLNFDTTTLKYYGVTKRHSALQSGMWLDNMVGNQIILSWFSLSPVTLSHDTLAILSLELLSGPSYLRWDTAVFGHCSYTNSAGEILPAVFEDGMVASDFITPDLYAPADGGNFHTDILVFLWESSGCGSNYELQISKEIDFNTLTHHFLALPDPFRIVNGLSLGKVYFWRVRSKLPSLHSPWSQVYTFSTGITGINQALEQDVLLVYPVPTTDYAMVSLPGNQAYQAYDIKIYTSQGSLVYNQAHHYEGKDILVDLKNLYSGLYIIQITFCDGFSNEKQITGRIIKK